MEVMFVRAIIENRVNLQGTAQLIEVGGSKQEEYHKGKDVILRNVTVVFGASITDIHPKELCVICGTLDIHFL